MTGITFDSYNLNGDGVYTTDTDVFSAPPINISAESLAESDGSVIVKRRIDPKVFQCEGYMVADTTEALDDLIDVFKTALNKQGQNFDIDYSGTTRRYVATPRNIVISRPKGLNSAGWSVEFYCAVPVGSLIAAENLFVTATTTLTQDTVSFTVNGSYKAEPLITVTIDSITGGTTKTITLSNASTLRGLSITRTWIATDVLEMDCLNKTIFVNNMAVEYTGQFPVWEPGNNGLTYLDDFTTRSVDIAGTYTQRYL